MRPDIIQSRALRALISFGPETRLIILLGCLVAWFCYPYTAALPDHARTNDTPAESKATFLAVGDIMLSRGVARTIDAAGGSHAPFSQMEELFRSTDFNFGNLESPVSGKDHREGRGLVFNARRSDIEGLVKNNFKIVNLANNHALDQGVEGLNFTRSFLTQKGIEYLGVGDDRSDAWQPRIVTANGIRIGFVGASYASINDGGVVTNEHVARIEDVTRLRESIGQLKSNSDYIVVTMHAGTEYVRRPDRSQIDFAHAAVDAGADMVIGAHPHWIQPFEQYRGKYIFYSLGNFIFDQRQPGTTEGLALRISVVNTRGRDARLEKIELLPVVIERFGIPRRATEAESMNILRKSGITERILKSS
jgi:gamma-polyglutamate biosynthesis protein CapA